MKIILLFFFFQCLALISFCQDWSLFPINQKSYYEHVESESRSFIELISLDSIVVQGIKQVAYFDTKLVNPGIGNCKNNFEAAVNPAYTNSMLKMHHILIAPDTVYFDSSNQILFLPNVGIGDSWFVNGYTGIHFTCTDIVLDTIFGIADSVKIFSLQETPVVSNQFPIDDYSIRLSKHYGLIQFIPFNLLVSHQVNIAFQIVKLIGIKDFPFDAGFSQGQFLDYFKYQPSDILIWNNKLVYNQFHSVNPNSSNFNYYYRDSITSVTSTQDSFYYYYDRITIENNGYVKTFNNRQAYDLNNDGSLLQAYPSSLAIKGGFNGNELFSSDALEEINDSITNSEILLQRFYSSGIASDSNCSISNSILGEFVEYNSQLGLTQIDYWALPYSWNYKKLVAARVSGNVYGDLNYKFENIFSLFYIYPNPATDKITFFGTQSGAINFNIFDAMGRVVMQRNGMYLNESIDVSSLLNGVYIVKAENETGSFDLKFVKVKSN